jgi:hypothetical protein
MPLFGREYRVISLDALIRAKKAAGKTKDLNALPELEALREIMRSTKRQNRRRIECRLSVVTHGNAKSKCCSVSFRKSRQKIR